MHSFIHNIQRMKGLAFHFISSSFGRLCLLAITFGLSGCGDFFAEKPTELESMNILRELSQITRVPQAAFPIPDVYTQPPRIVEGV
ncbi:MAG: hypothetical protein KAS23_12845, partial [Anaerohalosphaera sp.]|nr:hypothetical protein [Anaerohalosphaera sp.]